MSAPVRKSRSRAPNFCKEEQLLLIRVMEPYNHIIESKKTDEVKHVDKQETWSRITEIFNANSKTVPRSTENLISCYRNMKSKIKKQHSYAKMALTDSSIKQLVDAVEENGKNWDAVSQSTDRPAEMCETQFLLIEKQIKKRENEHKKKVMGTGGGPPPSDDDDDSVMLQMKKIIEPQIDGLFTIYDGDALLMEQFQETIPEQDRIEPIESTYIRNFGEREPTANKEENKDNKIECEIEIHGDTPSRLANRPIINRTNILKKKKALELRSCDKNLTDGSSAKKPKNVSESFLNLSQQKLELVKLQRLSLEMDIEQKRKVHSLELEELVQQNKHKDLIRQKEILLMDLKIKKASEYLTFLLTISHTTLHTIS